MGEGTRQVLLPDAAGNTDEAIVDDVTLRKGDTEPKDLTDDQIKRLRDAGMKLKIVGDDDDPLDGIRTHAEADAALEAAGITATGTVEEKVQALRAQDEG